ncbi:VOC family protein [Schumannella luteola]|uniref:PhnB protein n=1 Tax=Schumannella luteola TaxID=472059 RepID=A0A852YKI7_9MICO|nr:VOC family protein [Schumannella luteola]NYG97715.1 PhnB protein [Schumannella luteola]TPX01418.1 VOC family protein [Schumannella luteola]
MSITTTPHLNFDGDARAALEFYGTALGVAPAMMTYGQMGASQDPAWADRIVWGQVETSSGVRVMAFDVWPHQGYDQGENAFYVYLSGDDADEITAIWNGLVDGAEIRQPLGASAWSPLAGQLRDRFGVIWALDVRAEQGGDAEAGADANAEADTTAS